MKKYPTRCCARSHGDDHCVRPIERDPATAGVGRHRRGRRTGMCVQETPRRMGRRGAALRGDTSSTSREVKYGIDSENRAMGNSPTYSSTACRSSNRLGRRPENIATCKRQACPCGQSSRTAD
jgi:hypothetical protein